MKYFLGYTLETNNIILTTEDDNNPKLVKLPHVYLDQDTDLWPLAQFLGNNINTFRYQADNKMFPPIWALLLQAVLMFVLEYLRANSIFSVKNMGWWQSIKFNFYLAGLMRVKALQPIFKVLKEKHSMDKKMISSLISKEMKQVDDKVIEKYLMIFPAQLNLSVVTLNGLQDVE